jgi:hypothetical protein
MICPTVSYVITCGQTQCSRTSNPSSFECMERLLGSATIWSFCFFNDCRASDPRTERPNVVKDAMLKGRHVAARPFLYWLTAASNALLFWKVLTDAPLAGQEYAMAQDEFALLSVGHLRSLQLSMGLPLRPIMRSSDQAPGACFNALLLRCWRHPSKAFKRPGVPSTTFS